jgi:hypothetical protein
VQAKSKLVWCSEKKTPVYTGPINWASGQPASATDACVGLSLSNSSVTESTFALADCATAKYFVCEVNSKKSTKNKHTELNLLPETREQFCG